MTVLPGRLLRAVYGLVLSACLALAAFNLDASVRFYNLAELGRSLEGGDGFNPGMTGYAAARARDLVNRPTCRSDLLRPVMTIYMNFLAAAEQVSAWMLDPDILGAFDHALACDPRDGNLVLKRALLAYGINGRAADLEQALTRSLELAPSEWATMLTRLQIWTQFGTAVQRRHRDAIERDRRLVCANAPYLADRFSYKPTEAETALIRSLCTVPKDRSTPERRPPLSLDIFR